MEIKNIIANHPEFAEQIANAKTADEIVAICAQIGIEMESEAAIKVLEMVASAKKGAFSEREIEKFNKIINSADGDELSEDELDMASGGIVVSLLAIAGVTALSVGAVAICYVACLMSKSMQK